MIFQARNHRYTIKKDRRITHEAFTRRFALANLENKLKNARQELENLPGNHRRRQREKIWRLEQQIDKLRLELEK